MKTDREKWENYIIEKFKDTTTFIIKETSDNVLISSADNSVKTSIQFYFSENALEDIQFYDGIFNSWSGELSDGNSLEYSIDNVKLIEKNWLAIPIFNGWKVKQFFFISKNPYKTYVYYDRDKDLPDFRHYQSFFSPLIWVLTLGDHLSTKIEFFPKPISTRISII